MIQVLLAEDEALVRSGIRGLLALTPDIRVSAEAADGEEALALVRRSPPDVALLDIRMPRRSGIEVLETLKEEGAVLPPTILLTTFDDDEALLQGIRAGARGYLLKDISVERLAESIRVVAAGGTMIRPAITERVLRSLSESHPAFPSLDLPDPLTPRETEVLRLMAGGFSNREISEALRTSEGTIKNYASSILSKLGVRDRTRAVLKGIDLGYL
jgi:DNA-binding NarL/FixJ family response regulator